MTGTTKDMLINFLSGVGFIILLPIIIPVTGAFCVFFFIEHIGKKFISVFQND